MDMLKHDPIYDEPSGKLADAPNSLPSWNREALGLKIQSVDGCTPSEATLKIDEMAQRFSQLARLPFSSPPCQVEAPRAATIYVRRTDCSGLTWWRPPNLLRLLLEPGRI